MWARNSEVVWNWRGYSWTLKVRVVGDLGAQLENPFIQFMFCAIFLQQLRGRSLGE